MFPIPLSSIGLLSHLSVSSSCPRQGRFGDEFEVYTDHCLAGSVPSTNLLATSLTSILLVVLQQRRSPSRPTLSTGQTFGNRIVRLVTLAHPFPSRECARISLIRRQKIVSQDPVRDIALPPGVLIAIVLVIIRAVTCAPAPRFCLTSTMAFGFNSHHRILVPHA